MNYYQPYHPQYESESLAGVIETSIFLGIILLVLIYIVYNWYYGLTEEELADCEEIMSNFHRDPNYDDFIRVYDLRMKLLRQRGKPIKFWLSGVYDAHADYFDNAKKSEIALWRREITRGIGLAQTQPTSELLDCMWCMYFATGDQQYSDIVKNVAANCNNTIIRNAARWSYRSIMGVEYDHVDAD